jgi:hypothetical protein
MTFDFFSEGQGEEIGLFDSPGPIRCGINAKRGGHFPTCRSIGTSGSVGAGKGGQKSIMEDLPQQRYKAFKKASSFGSFLPKKRTKPSLDNGRHSS